MDKMISKKKMIVIFIMGLLGCVLMGLSDWLMIYGNTAFEGKLAWLTVGVAEMNRSRIVAAMMLSFPAVFLYAVALVGMKHLFTDKKAVKTYGALTTIGMTPWLMLHLFYVMILYLFNFLSKNGEKETALLAGEELFSAFSWIVFLGELFMVLPFLYFFFLILFKKTIYKKWMAFNNPLLLYLVLKVLTLLMKDSPVKLAFTNGLMSESMLLWFLILMVGYLQKFKRKQVKEAPPQ